MSCTESTDNADCQALWHRFEAALGGDAVRPVLRGVGVSFFRGDDHAPECALPPIAALNWCYAVRQAAFGEIVTVDREHIGCPIGAIMLGLVSADEDEALAGWRQYQAPMATPPTPREVASGEMFACASSGREDLALFGAKDPGRFETVEVARHAFQGMIRVEPADVNAVVAFPLDADLDADVVIAIMTPREAVRVVQALGFRSGERFALSTIGIAGVSSDLTARPYVTGEISGSLFCIGARAASRWEGQAIGFGIPRQRFEGLVSALEASSGGYPLAKYPRDARIYEPRDALLDGPLPEKRRRLLPHYASRAGITLTDEHERVVGACFAFHRLADIVPGPRIVERLSGISRDRFPALFPFGLESACVWAGIPLPGSGCKPLDEQALLDLEPLRRALAHERDGAFAAGTPCRGRPEAWARFLDVLPKPLIESCRAWECGSQRTLSAPDRSRFAAQAAESGTVTLEFDNGERLGFQAVENAQGFAVELCFAQHGQSEGEPRLPQRYLGKVLAAMDPPVFSIS